jgi:hypothetical protein
MPAQNVRRKKLGGKARTVAAVAAAAAVAASAGTATAFASSARPSTPVIQASTQVINGCYDAKDGTLHVSDAGYRCPPADIVVSWNQNGPQGNPGPRGPRGARGATGLNGAPGANGGLGPQGPQGAPGDVGAKGAAGPSGGTGLTGATGSSGSYLQAWDVDNVSLGQLIGESPDRVSVLTSTGYEADFDFEGGPADGGWIYFSGLDCTGTMYLNDGVLYGQFYNPDQVVDTNAGYAQVTGLSVMSGYQSGYDYGRPGWDTCSDTYNGINGELWPLAPVSAATVGLPSSVPIGTVTLSDTQP